MRNLDGPGKQPWKWSLCSNPERQCLEKNAQLPVHATSPCVILLLLSHFLLSQLPLQPLLLSMYASVIIPAFHISSLEYVIVFLCDREPVSKLLSPPFFFAHMYFLEMYFRRKIFHIKYARASRMLVTMLPTFHPTILYNWFHMYIFLVMCVYIHNFYIFFLYFVIFDLYI